MTPGILDGLRIVEGSAFVAAPLGGMTLAQLGAEVIRFDPPGGGLDAQRLPVTAEGRSLFWAGLNKGKKSIAIDIARPEGQELATALITAPGGQSGLFLTNFPARGWLAYEALCRRRPDLIHVNVLGDRHGGSEVDYTVNPRVGLPALTGPADDPRPVNHVLPAWDNICGQMAAVGLLAAERHRTRTGEGQYVKLALLDVALATLGHLGMLAEVEVNGEERARHGNDLYGAFGRDFPTRDGRRVMVVGLTARQWSGLGKATGLAAALAAAGRARGLDFARERDRFLGREAIAALLGPWIGARDYAEVAAAFDAAGVCYGPYQTVRELLERDPEASTANPLLTVQEQPGIGRYRMPGSPLYFSRAAHLDARPAPRLGEHTDQVLAEVLRLPAAEIGRLHDAGLVAGP
ncbi:MAG: CoA transferase [Steroidobacteraceae bacterium]|jgi:2-methylfumaryl-CoA isomerase|nr:CoA transferase [Steroidobacteraceae bacterium]